MTNLALAVLFLLPQAAPDPARQGPERPRDDRMRRIGVGRLARADERLALRRDRVAHAERPVPALGGGHAPLADPVVERDAFEAEGRRAAKGRAFVGAALEDARRDEHEPDEPAASRARGKHRPERLAAVRIGVAELDAVEDAVPLLDDRAERDEAGPDGERHA